MDELEQLVNQHRQALTTSEPIDADRSWTVLRARMGEQRAEARVRRLRWGLGVAVSLLLVLSLAWTLQPEEAVASPINRISHYAAEWAEEENAYLATIAAKEENLALEELDPVTVSPFITELQLIDSLQQEDMAQLPQSGLNPRLITTLIRYYQLKIQLLEQLENEIQRQNAQPTPLPVTPI